MPWCFFCARWFHPITSLVIGAFAVEWRLRWLGMGMCMVCFTCGLSEGVEYIVPWQVHFRIQMFNATLGPVVLYQQRPCANNNGATVHGVISDFFFF